MWSPWCVAPRLLPLAVLVALPLTAQVGRPARPSGGNELVVVATDFKFEAPEQVDAGLVNIRLFNRGKEMHHLLVIKVDRLDRLQQIGEMLRNNDWSVPWMTPLGGPESVASGGVSSASMVLEPGRYILACVVASPNTHRAHYMDGMLRELSVVQPPRPTSPAVLPPAEATIELYEWNYNIKGPLFAGRRTVRVKNIGKFEHHVWMVRLLPGTTIQQAVRWAENPSGAAPFEPVGGSTGIGAGREVNVTMDLMPGEYALLCTLFNPLSKRTHSAHGMIKPIRIVN